MNFVYEFLFMNFVIFFCFLKFNCFFLKKKKLICFFCSSPEPLVLELIQSGIDVTAPPKDATVPLIIAAEHYSSALVQVICRF